MTTHRLALLPLALALGSAPAVAQDVSVGGGLRTSFSSTDTEGVDEDVDDFALNSVRLYVNGSVDDNIGFTFNAEYDGDGSVEVLDAIARFEFSPMVNFWAGRMLPPSDRANLNGSYFRSQWGSFTDGVEGGFPFIFAGRNNGVAYWGNFGILNVSAGFFDVPNTSGTSDILSAARVHLSFRDSEPGYYINGTYYGDKDILSVGVAAQNVADDSAFTVDFLLEKKLPNDGVVTLEAEYADYDGLGGYTASPVPVDFSDSDGFLALGAYLFPRVIGAGRFQMLGKYARTALTTAGGDVDQDTLEFDLGYIIDDLNARLSLFYIDTSFDGPAGPDFKQIGLGLQLQM